MIKNCLALLSLYAILSGTFAIASPDGDAPLELVFGYAVGIEGVTFQVQSGGCTNKESFRIELQEKEPMGVALYRVQPDYCEAYLPYGVFVRFSYDEIGLRGNGRFQIVNPTGAIFSVVGGRDEL